MKIDASKLRALAKSRGLTNMKLASQAGITRQALQVMLRNGHIVEVRDRTAKGLAQALRLPDESLLSPDPLVGYKQAVANENADLAFRGLGLPTTEPRSMDEVFVPVRLVQIPERKREHDHDCQPAMVESDDGPIKESDELTVADCLTLHRRVLIRGEPGSGKTTSLRHAARSYSRGAVAEWPFSGISRTADGAPGRFCQGSGMRHRYDPRPICGDAHAARRLTRLLVPSRTPH